PERDLFVALRSGVFRQVQLPSGKLRREPESRFVIRSAVDRRRFAVASLEEIFAPAGSISLPPPVAVSDVAELIDGGLLHQVKRHETLDGSFGVADVEFLFIG